MHSQIYTWCFQGHHHPTYFHNLFGCLVKALFSGGYFQDELGSYQHWKTTISLKIETQAGISLLLHVTFTFYDDTESYLV